jgi:hypothetical protein
MSVSRQAMSVFRLALACALLAPPTVQDGLAAQPAPSSRLIIPSLANLSQPADLDFQAGECDVAPDGGTLECVFQQVFLTVALFDAQTCLVTTNRYARTFKKETDTRWVSREGPEGPCGVEDIATLVHGGGARWTLEMRRVVTRPSPSCPSVPEPEILSWQNVRRPVPCRYVQPGAMSR